jgi:hypothetical protein
MLKFVGENSFLRAVVLTTLPLVVFCLEAVIFGAMVMGVIPSP